MSKIILATHSTIRNLLILLIIIMVTLFLFLKNGISIDELKIGSFYVEKLYLKLDKKIIIYANKLIIPKEKKKREIGNIKKILDDIKNILKYFQYIELKEVDFKNNTYTILYSDKIIYMKDDEVEIALDNIDYLDNKIYAKLKLVNIKKYNVNISGNLVYNVKSSNFIIKADAKYRDIKSKFVVNKKENRIYFVLKSKKFKELEPLVKEFNLSDNLNLWIYKNLQAKSYKVEYLKGILISNENGTKVLPESISAKFTLEDVKIIFNKKLSPVLAKGMEITFKDDNMSFNLKKPSFKKSLLDGSIVYLDGFIKKPLTFHLDLDIKTKFDKSIKEILKFYNLDIPVVQTQGSARAKIKMDIDLDNTKVKFSGDIVLTKSKVKIGDITLPVKKAHISIKKDIVSLSNVVLSDNMLDVDIDGKIYLKKQQAELLLDIKKIKDKKNILHIKEKKEKLLIDYKKDIIFKLSSLDSKIQFNTKEKSISISIVDINKIKPYLYDTPLKINSGSLTINSKDFNSYSYSGKFGSEECFFYTHNDSCLFMIPVNGVFSPNNLTLNAFDNGLIYSSKLSTITLNKLNLDLEKLFERYKSKGKEDKSNNIKKITIKGRESTIRYKDYKLITDNYTVKLDKKGGFSFVGNLKKDIVSINMNSGFLTIKANKITDKMLHPLINFKGLQKGKYTIKILRNQENISKGVITIDGGVVRDFKTYNNIMAFINTIPSLATLHKPGFSKNGFKIQKGIIKFTINKDILTLKSILIEGAAATISGSGIVNLSTENIRVDLIIMTAREVSKIIKSLPIVGHILMGDKNSVSVGLKIRGTLERTKIKISAIKDLMLLPLEIIKRTLSAPSYIYKKTRKAPKNIENNLDMY